MIGKFIAILDWEIARDRTGEYYCANVAERVLAATNQCIEAAGRLANRQRHSVEYEC
jgi:glycerol dehydrogenase-like iron-containing ADH family enzyme